MTESSKKSETSDDPALERRQKYNRAVREARLVTIVLTSVKFEVKRKTMTTEQTKRQFIYGGEVKQFAILQEKVLGASIKWTVTIKSDRKTLSFCSATYDIIYDRFSSLDDEIGELFAENVAQPATYAYFRALYANLDWSADFHSPPLPVIKFHPKI